MNPGTKIVIIKSKHLLYASILAVIAIILLVILVINATKKPKDSTTNAPVTYNAGVYTSSLTLNGNPVELQITLDSNKIKNIELVNVSESVTTMYPLIQPTLDDIAKQICKNNSTDNITYNEESKYTALILLEAIEFTLNKAIIY
ncbi:MAG: hypothetical protein IKL73_08510 [Lachnospiraceae bacterium]|nr:hypothetical protein [Lachnospira sp.]MBR6698283.1 hypothetical protein [Lachnospiraceae bacterium]